MSVAASICCHPAAHSFGHCSASFALVSDVAAAVTFGLDTVDFAFARVAAVVPSELVAAVVTLELDAVFVIFLSVAAALVFAAVVTFVMLLLLLTASSLSDERMSE